MTDEEEREEESDEEEYEINESLTDEEKRKRWLRQWLRLQAKKATRKLEKGRKVPDGFQDAFGGQENAHKYYRHHDFKFGKERGDEIKVPESKPLGKPAMGFTEPNRWIPPKHTEDYPKRKDATETLQIHEKPIDEHGRREAERAERTDDKDKDDFREADALGHDDLAVEKTQNDNSTEQLATLDIEAPRSSAPDLISKITSQMEDAGYDLVSTSVKAADYTFEPSFLEDDLERMESMARQDSTSAPALSETQDEIEKVLEIQSQEMLQDSETEPQVHSELPDSVINIEVTSDPLDPKSNPLKRIVEGEVEDA